MAGTTITMSTLKQILLHRRNGTGLQTISKMLGIARNTVKKYLQIIDSRHLDVSVLLQMEDHELQALLDGHSVGPRGDQRYARLAPLLPYIQQELSKTGVNRWHLWGEYKASAPDGYSYSQFCEHYRQWLKSRQVSMHLEHEPGDKLFVDFAGDRLALVDPSTGEVSYAEVFLATLGYSQFCYVEAIASQTKEDFIAVVERALRYFGGVPKALVPDNLKSAVTQADRYEPLINHDFLDFANHYGFAVVPARSRKPQDKALVEKAVSTVYSRIYAPLRHNVYHNLKTLNQDIRYYLKEHNQKPFQRRPESRAELFEKEEKALLQPLPAQRYELKQYKQATVMKISHIYLKEDKHYYSVPYRFTGKKVKIAYSQSYVSVFYNQERIAHHPRSYKANGYSTQKDHMPSTHQFVSEWNPEKFLTWAKGIHPDVHDYISRILEHYSYPEQAYKSCLGVLSLDKKVGRQRLIHAVKRASLFGSYNYSVVVRILRSGLDRLALEEEIPEKAIDHPNIRGAKEYR